MPLFRYNKPVRGSIDGMVMSNNVADATNDIDFAAGQACDSTFARYIEPSAITKQLDAAWAAGSAAGGRDTGSIADGWWYPWSISNGAGGDYLFSTSVSAPTMPSGYTFKRRVGAIKRVSGVIKPFVQYGAEILWKDSITEVDDVNPGTSAVTVTLTGVPTGIAVEARVRLTLVDTTQNNNVLLTSLSQTNVNPTSTGAPLSSVQSSVTTRGRTEFYIWTNTSAQIRYIAGASNATTIVSITTVGWREYRQRDGAE